MRYDRTLKELLQGAPRKLLEQILGTPVRVAELLAEEFQSVKARRPDL